MLCQVPADLHIQKHYYEDLISYNASYLFRLQVLVWDCGLELTTGNTVDNRILANSQKFIDIL